MQGFDYDENQHENIPMSIPINPNLTSQPYYTKNFNYKYNNQNNFPINQNLYTNQSFIPGQGINNLGYQNQMNANTTMPLTINNNTYQNITAFYTDGNTTNNNYMNNFNNNNKFGYQNSDMVTKGNNLIHDITNTNNPNNSSISEYDQSSDLIQKFPSQDEPQNNENNNNQNISPRAKSTTSTEPGHSPRTVSSMNTLSTVEKSKDKKNFMNIQQTLKFNQSQANNKTEVNKDIKQSLVNSNTVIKNINVNNQEVYNNNLDNALTPDKENNLQISSKSLQTQNSNKSTPNPEHTYNNLNPNFDFGLTQHLNYSNLFNPNSNSNSTNHIPIQNHYIGVNNFNNIYPRQNENFMFAPQHQHQIQSQPQTQPQQNNNLNNSINSINSQNSQNNRSQVGKANKYATSQPLPNGTFMNPNMQNMQMYSNIGNMGVMPMYANMENPYQFNNMQGMQGNMNMQGMQSMNNSNIMYNNIIDNSNYRLKTGQNIPTNMGYNKSSSSNQVPNLQNPNVNVINVSSYEGEAKQGNIPNDKGVINSNNYDTSTINNNAYYTNNQNTQSKLVNFNNINTNNKYINNQNNIENSINSSTLGKATQPLSPIKRYHTTNPTSNIPGIGSIGNEGVYLPKNKNSKNSIKKVNSHSDILTCNDSDLASKLDFTLETDNILLKTLPNNTPIQQINPDDFNHKINNTFNILNSLNSLSKSKSNQNPQTLLAISIKLKDAIKLLEIKQGEDISIVIKTFIESNNIDKEFINPILSKLNTAIRKISNFFTKELSTEDQHYLGYLKALNNCV